MSQNHEKFTEENEETITSSKQAEIFRSTRVDVTSNRCCEFMNGIYCMYIFMRCYSLHKALQSIYIINIQLCLITLVTLIPIAQKNKGKEIDIQLILALLKLFELIIIQIVIRRVILQYRMK